MLYLRVNRKFLRLFPTATPEDPNPLPILPLPGTTGILNVIIANLDNLRPFSGNTVDWLIAVARLIFEPLGMSSLYTFTTHTLDYWLEREMDDSQWRVVSPGENLRATIYEFRPANDALITLTQMSFRRRRTHTTEDSRPRTTQFRTACLRRDQRCIITQHSRIKASHLIPRCLGDAGVQSVFQRFTGLPATVDRYDPRMGVMLSPNLDSYVDSYDLGLWNNGPVSPLPCHTPLHSHFLVLCPQDQYVVHDFLDTPVNLYGAEPVYANERMCHGTQITLFDHSGSSMPVARPPVGVFNWHYIQCVLKKFASADYRNFGNVSYFVRPFHTGDGGDDSDEDDDESDRDFDDLRNIADPPYPSYFWDLAQARALQRLEEAERHQAILAWNSHVVAD